MKWIVRILSWIYTGPNRLPDNRTASIKYFRNEQGEDLSDKNIYHEDGEW